MNVRMIALYIYLLFAFFVECFARLGARDAFEYKKSNSLIKKQKQQYKAWRNMFRVYPKEDTFAPRHSKLFYIVRIVNFIFVLIVIILVACFCFDHSNISIYIIMSVIALIFFAPFIAYMIYLIIISNPPHKIITFDKFNNP